MTLLCEHGRLPLMSIDCFTSSVSTENHSSIRAVLAENLVLLRRERGMSQEALALEAGFHRTFVTHVEGKTRNIAIDNIEKLAIALNVEPYELLRPQREHENSKK